MKSEKADFSAAIHCCRPKFRHLFAASQVCCHVSESVSAFLPADRMIKLFIFASENLTDLHSKPRHLCVKANSFMKLHLIWNKAKNVRSFSVPISCMYRGLNQREIVLEKCVGGNVQSIRTPEKGKWNLTKLPWDFLCLKCCSVWNIHVKGVNFSQCEIPAACT